MKAIDCRSIRLKNRRVLLAHFEDGSWQMVFRRLGDKATAEPRVVKTTLALTEEAMNAVFALYLQMWRPNEPIAMTLEIPEVRPRTEPSEAMVQAVEVLWDLHSNMTVNRNEFIRMALREALKCVQ